MNYSEKTLNINYKRNYNTWIHFSFNSEDIVTEFGNSVPYPQHHYLKDNEVVYCWLIDGFFETKKNLEYLNDIIARFKISFDDCRYLKKQKAEQGQINPLKLRNFQNLKSRAIQKINYSTKYDGTKDFIFYCLKLHAEMIIKEKGIFSYDELLEFAIDNFTGKAKDQSTLKAKCNNIFNWYLERNFKLTKKYVKKDKGEVMATRQEQARKMHTKLAQDTKRKVLNFITGMFAQEYKKKDGNWNIMKIAKDTGTTRPTVYKYIQETQI